MEHEAEIDEDQEVLLDTLHEMQKVHADWKRLCHPDRVERVASCVLAADKLAAEEEKKKPEANEAAEQPAIEAAAPVIKCIVCGKVKEEKERKECARCSANVCMECLYIDGDTILCKKDCDLGS